MVDEQPYYIGHFLNVLDSVEKHYSFMLSKAERRHIDILRALPESALCLYVRLANRKGPYFRIDKLDYAECHPIDATTTTLLDMGLLQSGKALDYGAESMLQTFTQVELRSYFKEWKFPRAANKKELSDWLIEELGTLESLHEKYTVVSLMPNDPWSFLKFLYFGELTDNLSGFVVQELGHIVTEKHPASALKPVFASRKSADDCYRISLLYQGFKARRDAISAKDLYTWWCEQQVSRLNLCPNAYSIHDRLVAKLGFLLERANCIEEAKALYVECHTPPCRERLARLLLKEGKKDDAIALCKLILIAPTNSEEQYNVLQLLNRMQGIKKQSETREKLKAANEIYVEASELPVETATLYYYQQQGWQGVYCENWLWNALFGLLLWDIIYDGSYGGFHHPLQIAPADLYDPRFYAVRSEAIEARIELLTNKVELLAFIGNVAEQKAGINNPFVGWYEGLIPALTSFIHHLPANGMAAVLRHIAQDVKQRSKGFPDLFLWKEHEYLLIEVKSVNDSLSTQQYHWLQFMQLNGINAQALRVLRAEAQRCEA